MAEFDFDLFVIGGGSGGVRAARMAAEAGARVAIAEEFRYGGTCVIRGCVPKKLLVYASQFSESFADAAGFGWSVGETSFDWPSLIAAKDAEIARLEGIYVRNLGSAGVEVFRGRATVADPHTVHLATHAHPVRARHILVATGGTPFVPDFPGSEHAITSNEVFDLPDLPASVVIVGGGYIACEFAGILNGLGAAVTLAYRGPQILRGFDDEVRAHVADEMRAKGVEILTGTDVAAIDKGADGCAVTLASGETRRAGTVLYATGRIPNTAGLGLEAAGVRLGRRGEVAVDAFSQTSVPSIYAVGDVTDRLALTPVAIREGAAFAETVFRGNPTRADHALVPTAVFTQPEIGTVGLSEEQARAEGEIEVYRAAFRPMNTILAGRDERMLMKLIVAADSRRVLGVHIVGHGAGEMIQLAGVAVKMGATKEDFDRTVAVHPTAAEELVTMKTPVGAPPARTRTAAPAP
ncbi:glutathione-disulfide reductase [Paralimibaculum aggregatum]|uniref:Glutathione reductase n=1 Tax=Paralimibaculum aggregatum TaxID=3036245 RepID=A0ABQ6LPZ4_9RHOB|nr:glutathione-disulfide reductase [Limibaculum sp. NKW23]GMG84716.1 glutathione-disulfide reductase [Limibaculum sp. NKW23]